MATKYIPAVLLAVALLCQPPAPAATGDVLGVTVRADGWSADVSVEGFSTGATYDFSGSAVSLALSSMGFDSAGEPTTVPRTILGTAAVRRPYPDHAQKDEVIVDGNLIVRISLSEYVYRRDVQIAADLATGWCVSGSTPSTQATAIAVVNASAVEYPQAIGQWDGLGFSLVREDFLMGATARHRLGIACVRFDAVGAACGSFSESVSAEGWRTRPATGLVASGYWTGTLVPIAAFAQGEIINLRFRAYPRIGDDAAVLDTASMGSLEEILGCGPRTLTCDKLGTLTIYAVVDLAGSDVTGAVSPTLATAEASPFATIGKAVATGATVVYLRDGVHAAVGWSPPVSRATTYWVEVASHPTSTTAGIRLSSIRTYRCQRLLFRDLPVTLTDTTSYLDGEGLNSLWFDGCTFDSSGVAKPSTGPGYRSKATFLTDCGGDLGISNWATSSYGTSWNAYWFDGCTLEEASPTSVTLDCWYHMMACSAIGSVKVGERSVSNPAPIQDGVFCDFNRFLDYDSASTPQFRIGQTNPIMRGLSLVGNVAEKTIGISPLWQVAADGSTADPVDNILIWHNTFAGERENFAYNDRGSEPRWRRGWSVKLNAFRHLAIKTDTNTAVDGGNGARIGNWSMVYGVGCARNLSEIVIFPQDYPGEGWVLVGSGGMGYVDDQSFTVGGAGGGNYAPAAGSPLLGQVGEVIVPVDLTGTAIVVGGAAGSACSVDLGAVGHAGGVEPRLADDEPHRRQLRPLRVEHAGHRPARIVDPSNLGGSHCMSALRHHPLRVRRADEPADTHETRGEPQENLPLV